MVFRIFYRALYGRPNPTKENTMFLPTNEFTVSLPNPVKNPNVIALKMTRKSKRNLLIKHGLLPLAFVAVLPFVSAFIDGLIEGADTNPDLDQTPDTPTED
jgi:hypothetical protein